MYFDFTLEEFHQYKGNWLLYRSMGHLNESGAFVSPLSYTEAQGLPKRQVEMFLQFDELADKMIRQINKKKGMK